MSLEERVASLENGLKAAVMRIEELEGLLWKQRLIARELEAERDTGQAHRWCPVCHKVVRTFSRVYMDHPADGGVGKCTNSLKPWTGDRFAVR